MPFDDALMRQKMLSSMRTLLECIEARLFFPEWVDHEEDDADHTSEPPNDRSPLSEAHLDKLLRDEIVEEIVPTSDTRARLTRLSRANRAFLVLEHKEGKPRLRWILWTRKANRLDRAFLRAVLDGRKMRLPQPDKMDPFEAHTAAWGVDLTAAFYQRRVPPNSEAFVFSACGRFFKAQRMPMGSTLSPVTLQLYVAFLAAGGLPALQKPIFENRAEAANFTTRVVVYLDNIRCAGSRGAVKLHAGRIVALARECRVSITKEFDVARDSPGGMEYKFLGGIWSPGEVRVSEKLRGKLTSLAGIWSPEGAPVAAVESAIGAALWASRLLQLSVAPFLKAYIPARRHVAAWRRRFCQGVQTVRFGAEARAAGLEWWQALLSKGSRIPRRARLAPLRWTVWTDASNVGWGVVTFSESGGTRSFGARWDETQRRAHINIKEAWAARCGLEAVATEAQEELLTETVGVLAYCDSKAVLGAVSRGFSPADDFGKAIQGVVLAQKGLRVQWEYVESLSNPADEPSRRPDSFPDPTVSPLD